MTSARFCVTYPKSAIPFSWFVLASLLLPTAVAGQAQDSVLLRANRVCADCIQLTQTAVLRLPDTSDGFVSPTTFGRTRDGSYLAMDPFSGAGVHVFDSSGRYQRTLGQRGRGPGEFTFIETFVVDRSDTIRIFGSNQSIFLHSGKHIRSSTPASNLRPIKVAALANQHFLFMGMAGTPELFGVPFHLVRGDGTRVTSFGAKPGEAVGRRLWDRRQSMAVAADGRIFSAFANRYAIEQWSPDGKLVGILNRKANWFSPWHEWDGKSDATRPPSRLAHLLVIDPDRLLVVNIVADSRWRPTAVQPGEQPFASVPELEERFDTILEVLDLNTLEVVASHRLPGIVVGTFGPNYLALTREEKDGAVAVTIWRVSIDTKR